jgi:hypothetical protein
MSAPMDRDLARTLRRQRLLLLALFGLSIPVITPYLRGDGIAYYAYVASAIIDGDLQFENEYRRSDPVRCARYFEADGSPRADLFTSTGHLLNYHSAGTSFLWAPFFALTHAGVLLHNAAAPPERAIAADGYSRPYRWACALGTALFGMLALLLAHGLAFRIASPWAALLATLGIWFAGNLAVYMYLLPFLSHPASALVNATFLWVWWATARDPAEVATLRTPSAWFALGALSGFAFATYYIGALFGIFVIADGVVMLRAWLASGAAGSTHVRNAARIALPGLAGLLLGMLPHAIPKWILYGDPLALGYGLEWQPGRPFLLEVLFSSNHGLLTWHPIYLLSLLGLAALLPRFTRLAAASLIAFAACVWLVASKPNWHGGSAFGNRYFLVLTPIFLVGVAGFLDAASRWLAGALGSRGSWARPALTALLAALAVWNAGFLIQWGTNLVPNRGPVSFREVAANQVTAVPARFASVLLPFITDRSAVVRKVEREDIEEIEEAYVAREGICDPVN